MHNNNEENIRQSEDFYHLLCEIVSRERYCSEEEDRQSVLDEEKSYYAANHLEVPSDEEILASLDYEPSDWFSLNSYAVFKGNDGNIVIYHSSCEDSDGPECLSDTDSLIEYAIENLTDEVKSSHSLILVVYQLCGTTVDYTLIYDDDLYDRVSKTDNGLEILSAVYSYIDSAEDEKARCCKHVKIVDGKCFPYIK